MLQCYNKGCGQKFDPNNNKDDSCCHHPGEPYFHDAYKKWSCCKKKTVDFTEFLNIKGCTLSKHSNEKPIIESKKPQKDDTNYEEVVKVNEPIKVKLERPSFDSQMITIKPTVMPALVTAIDNLVLESHKEKETKSDEIAVGTICKNGGCNESYSPEKASTCQYHSGVPIFHEGMKYWSCCQRKTSNFTAFINQAGCSHGKHKWITNDDKKKVNCRYDWHQTPSNVIVAVYAKMYHYAKSTVKVNPIRLSVCLVFPNQDNAEFNIDLELKGIIKPEETMITMYPTKVEIKMLKAEASLWSDLNFPHKTPTISSNKDNKETKKLVESSDSDDDILDDIEPVTGARVTDFENL